MDDTEYLVCNENTLCYRQPGQKDLGVLAGKILKGGRDWKNGCFHPSPSDVLRTATKEDFDSFRVSSKGYFKE